MVMVRSIMKVNAQLLNRDGVDEFDLFCCLEFVAMMTSK